MFENVLDENGQTSEREFYLTYRVTGQKIRWTKSDNMPIGILIETLKQPEFSPLIAGAIERIKNGEKVTEAESAAVVKFNEEQNKFYQKLIRSVAAGCDPEVIPDPAEDKLDLLTFSMSIKDLAQIRSFFLSR